MNRLGWAVVHIKTVQTITTLHHGCNTQEEALEWGKAWILNNPGEPSDDIFILENLNQPEKRIRVMEVLMEEWKHER